MRLVKPVAATGVVALMGALAACGGSSDNNSGSSQQTQDTAINSIGNTGSGKDPNAKAPAPDIAGAKKGGTIYIRSIAGLTTMDPTEAYYTNTGSILTNLVTRALTQYEYDPKTKDMILIPDLATNLGTPNKDYTQWTFTIRKGIKYENGKDVTPDDIKYGIERAFDRDAFPTGTTYTNDYFLCGQPKDPDPACSKFPKGYRGPYKDGTDYPGVVVSGQNLTIKMARPFPDMPYYGAFPAMGPVPQKGSSPGKYRLHPLATGPYKFASYSPGASLTLVKNTYWDPNTDPGRHQYVDKWSMQFTVDPSQTDQIIINDRGQGQTTLTYDNILSADYGKAVQKGQDRIVKGGQPCTFFFSPDNRKIKDVKVREALAYAYPWKNVMIAGGEIIGVTRTPGTTTLPPGTPGRVDYTPPAPSQPGVADPAKAKALLKEAGYSPGQYKIAWPYIKNDPQAVAAMKQLTKGLKAGGFNPQPVATADSNAYAEMRADPKAPINARPNGWCSDWPSGLSWFPIILASGNGSNYSYFSNKAMDAKFKTIATMPLAKQPAAWGALDKEITTKYFPNVNTGYGLAVMMRGSKIGGMYDDNTYGMPTLRQMYVK